MGSRCEALVVVSVWVAAASCGRSDAGGYTVQEFERTGLAVVAAAVPAEWRDEIKPVAKTGEGGKLRYAAPASWTVEDDEHVGPTLSPPDGTKASALVNVVDLSVTCQGSCSRTLTDWKPEVDEFRARTRATPGIMRDAAVGDDAQVVVLENEELQDLTMLVVRWQRGGSRMLTGKVRMSNSPEAKTLLPLLEKICVTARARRW